MKKIGLFTLTLLLFSTIFISCKKEETNTELELTVRDNLGNNISNALVSLYPSETDLINRTNAITSKFTDSNGKVLFSDLTSMKYYWFAESGCQNNFNSSVTTITSIPANTRTSLNTIISGTGTLRFVNTSANPYKIFINGTYKFDVLGGQSKNLNYSSSGSYNLRVLQISGYLLYPTDQTYSGILYCGSTLTTTFP
jgi:hypothetical protein